MSTGQEFDVFLCHNSEDKPAVIKVAEQLRSQGLKPWLDIWELQPGAVWQYSLEYQIENISAAAVFVGKSGIGPWQSEEIYAFLQEFTRRRCPVIPVILPTSKTQPRLPILLSNRHWVDFRSSEPEPFAQLIWGITGERCKNELSHLQQSDTKPSDIHTDIDLGKLCIEARYLALYTYLTSSLWEEADRETYRLLITEAGKTRGEWFTNEDVEKLSCKLLEDIDSLWMKHSSGKFGFSAQKEIYQDLGGSNELKDSIVLKLSTSVGWRDTVWNGDISSPDQLLPFFPKGYFPRCRSVSTGESVNVLNRPHSSWVLGFDCYKGLGKGYTPMYINRYQIEPTNPAQWISFFLRMQACSYSR